MKRIAIYIIVLILLCVGCRKEKKINGVICKKRGSNWIPIANFCVNCEEYELGDFCNNCGEEQSLVIGKVKCIKCSNLTYIASGGKYCGNCGGKWEIVLVVKNPNKGKD